MSLWFEIALTVAALLALFVGSTRLAARSLHLDGVRGQLVATLLRLSLTLVVAIGIAVGAGDHRVALLFTVGATYFAATLVDGLVKFRNRETDGCRTR